MPNKLGGLKRFLIGADAVNFITEPVLPLLCFMIPVGQNDSPLAETDFTQTFALLCTALFCQVKGGCHYLLTGSEILQDSWWSGVSRGEVKGFVI